MKAEKAVHKHEGHMHKGKPKTKFSSGGKTNMDMLKLGRNRAKIKAQGKG